MLRRGFLNSILIFHLCLALSHAQQIDPDRVRFNTIAIWKDLRQCLRDTLDPCNTYSFCLNGQIADCTTNACLCRGSTLGQAVINAGAIAMSKCSNLDDRSSATSILTSYCADKGYTEIVTPTILTSGASKTVTITATPTTARTVTAYATAYATRTIYSSSGHLAVEPDQMSLVSVLMSILALFLGPHL